jgi:hypothetical protein
VTVGVGVFVAPLPPDPVGSRLQVALQLESEMQHWVCPSRGLLLQTRNCQQFTHSPHPSVQVFGYSEEV